MGNTRVLFYDRDGNNSINSSEEILTEEHYYPFGMNMKGDWSNMYDPDWHYKYNGKELHDDHGLNWYAYGARYYDPGIARFTGVDPISDQFAHVSTYNYAENSPIAHIDLHGLQKHRLGTILKERAAGLINKVFGTDIPTSGKSRSKPVRHGKISISAEGNLKAGLGVGVKGSAFGLKGEINADAGSFRVAEASIGTEGISGNIIDSENHTLERDASISVSATDNIKLGAGFEQKEITENGEVVSSQVEGRAGLKVGDTTYGVSTGKELQGNSDVKTFSLSIGFGAQLIIGGEAKIKIELKTSTHKEKVE